MNIRKSQRCAAVNYWKAATTIHHTSYDAHRSSSSPAHTMSSHSAPSNNLTTETQAASQAKRDNARAIKQGKDAVTNDRKGKVEPPRGGCTSCPYGIHRRGGLIALECLVIRLEGEESILDMEVSLHLSFTQILYLFQDSQLSSIFQLLHCQHGHRRGLHPSLRYLLPLHLPRSTRPGDRLLPHKPRPLLDQYRRDPILSDISPEELEG